MPRGQGAASCRCAWCLVLCACLAVQRVAIGPAQVMLDMFALDGPRLAEWIRREGINGQKAYVMARLGGEGELVVEGGMLPVQPF
jgi:hypothetical protein